jgi:uncharacterized protein (TIGR01777 family)
MRVFITGGTGLIGRNLTQRLLERGDEAVVLTRSPDKPGAKRLAATVQRVQGDPMVAGEWSRAVDGCDAVVNLAGQNIFGKRWDADVRRSIRDSRVFSTGNVVAAMATAKSPPKTLVQASAIGYYGPHGDEDVIETTPPGSDFMAQVCIDWEKASEPAEALGARRAVIRIGVVLAPNEGALGVMTPIFKWLPGGAAPVGGGHPLKPAFGKVWLSWVHIDDIVGLLLLAIDNPQARGAINGTAPNPVRNADFGRALAKAVHRPFLPIGPPDALLKLVLGDVAEVITSGLKVIPKRAKELGYQFAYPEVSAALAAIFAKKQTESPTTKPARAVGA